MILLTFKIKTIYFYCNNIANHNCILDEAAFIPENIMENFTQSVFPTIASRPNGKIIAVSTPLEIQIGLQELIIRHYINNRMFQEILKKQVKMIHLDGMPLVFHGMNTH